MALENILLLFETLAMMLEFWNEGNAEKVVEYYSKAAVLFDNEDNQVVRVAGKNDISEYLTILFELSKNRGRSQMKLHCKKMIAKGQYILCSGTYYWPNMQTGRYSQQWQYKSGHWRLVEHKLTIDKIFAPNQSNKENIDVLVLKTKQTP